MAQDRALSMAYGDRENIVIGECDDLLFDETNDSYGLSTGISRTSNGDEIETVSLCVYQEGVDDPVEYYPITFVLKALILELKKGGKDVGRVIADQLEYENQKIEAGRKEHAIGISKY